MKKLIKLALLVGIVLFALINYRIFSFNKGIHKTDLEDKSISKIISYTIFIIKTGILQLLYNATDNDLSSLTQENGVFTRGFPLYEEVPSHLVDKIIKEVKL
jgi:translation elongation factor EF-G